MEPTPESEHALRELDQYDDESLRALLHAASEEVQRIVPECWGMSLTVLGPGDVTFTLVASAEEAASLDAVQYLGDGPCERSAIEGRLTRVDDLRGPLDEERWREFAAAGAAAGVLSTLSLPLRMGDQLTGGVNLYASAPHAFEGHEEQIAAVFGAWASDAVANADMPFTSRERAELAPGWLDDQQTVSLATGITMARFGVGAHEARSRLAEAARRAGVHETVLARTVLTSVTSDPSESR